VTDRTREDELREVLNSTASVSTGAATSTGTASPSKSGTSDSHAGRGCGPEWLCAVCGQHMLGALSRRKRHVGCRSQKILFGE
jgi:hypothetical protein